MQLCDLGCDAQKEDSASAVSRLDLQVEVCKSVCPHCDQIPEKTQEGDCVGS